MRLFFKTLTGKMVILDVDKDKIITILHLKILLSIKINMPVTGMRFMFGNREMENNKKINFYGVETESQINVQQYNAFFVMPKTQYLTNINKISVKQLVEIIKKHKDKQLSILKEIYYRGVYSYTDTNINDKIIFEFNLQSNNKKNAIRSWEGEHPIVNIYGNIVFVDGICGDFDLLQYVACKLKSFLESKGTVVFINHLTSKKNNTNIDYLLLLLGLNAKYENQVIILRDRNPLSLSSCNMNQEPFKTLGILYKHCPVMATHLDNTGIARFITYDGVLAWEKQIKRKPIPVNYLHKVFNSMEKKKINKKYEIYKITTHGKIECFMSGTHDWK